MSLPLSVAQNSCQLYAQGYLLSAIPNRFNQDFALSWTVALRSMEDKSRNLSGQRRNVCLLYNEGSAIKELAEDYRTSELVIEKILALWGFRQRY
jgi:hypothetical protein